MKNVKLQKRIDKFVKEADYNNTNGSVNGDIYFTENLVNSDYRYWSKKYFFCYHNTNTVVVSFRTQAELDEFLINYNF